MKIILTIFILLALSFLTVKAVNESVDFVSLKFDDTNICVPKEYVPGVSPFAQFLQKNVEGLDSIGQSQTIRLPAKVIMEGVSGYEFSHINKNNVDLEHTVSGIANGLSEITGTPDLYMSCEDKYNLGFCHQRIVYKTIFFQYYLKSYESKNKERVQKYLKTLFANWESNCEMYG